MSTQVNLSNDARFDKIDAALDRLTIVMIKNFNRLDKMVERKADKEDMYRLYNLMDKIAKQQEINDDERLVMGFQLERLNRWVHQLAKKIGYKLST